MEKVLVCLGAFFGLIFVGILFLIWVYVCQEKKLSGSVRIGGYVVVLVLFALCGVAGYRSLLVAFSGWGENVHVEQDLHKEKAQAEEQDGQSVELIRGYRHWTKINPTPVRMEPQAATACDFGRPNQLPSPHLQKYITVFVNPVGRDAIARQKHPEFPKGTVIVKEKLATLTSKSPDLMTVMYKHDKGYNPDCDDWEFLVYDGTGTKVERDTNQEKCQSCHQQASNTDFVFRDYYLPRKQMDALK